MPRRLLPSEMRAPCLPQAPAACSRAAPRAAAALVPRGAVVFLLLPRLLEERPNQRLLLWLQPIELHHELQHVLVLVLPGWRLLQQLGRLVLWGRPPVRLPLRLRRLPHFHLDLHRSAIPLWLLLLRDAHLQLVWQLQNPPRVQWRGALHNSSPVGPLRVPRQQVHHAEGPVARVPGHPQRHHLHEHTGRYLRLRDLFPRRR